jgi:hypothetical protein
VQVGPLGPIEVAVGLEVDSITLELHPLTELALQARFPGSCRNESVSVRASWAERATIDWRTSADGLRKLTEQLLPVLTGLRPEEMQVFGSYQVIDPVTERVLVPPTPVQPCGGSPSAAGGDGSARGTPSPQTGS